MWMHKFVILLVILFIILGVTFYCLIDSGVLQSDKVQNVVHVFDKEEKEVEEEIEEEIEEIEGTEEAGTAETTDTAETAEDSGASDNS